MAIENPQVNTQIDTPTINNPNRELLLRMLLLGSEKGADLGSKLGEMKTAQNYQEQNAQTSRDALESFIKEHPEAEYRDPQGAETNPTPGLNLQRFNIGLNSKNVKDAQGVYNKGLTKLQDQVQSIDELGKVIDNPNQMSLGLARTKIISALGMNRYNGDEAKAILPSSLYKTVSGIMSAPGGDSSSLSPTQVRDIGTIATGLLDTAQSRHNTLKSTALNHYIASPGSNQDELGVLKDNLGGPLDAQISNLRKQYADRASTSVQAEAPKSTPPQQGILNEVTDKLSSYFNPKSAASQQAASPSGPHGPTVYQNGQVYKWNPQTNNYE